MASNVKEEDLKNQVEETIRCPLCLEIFEDPRMLPCSHTFCFKCIKDWAKHNQGQFQCPLRDGTKISGKKIDSLSVNLVVRDIVDVFKKNTIDAQCCNCKTQKSTRWCKNCKSKGFCLECYEDLHKPTVFADHESSESKLPKVVTCSDHPAKEAEFWCRENKALYCSICLIEKQQQHKCELITDAVKETIDSLIVRFIEHPLTTNPEVEINDMITKYEKESNGKKAAVVEIFASLRQLIDEREKSILETMADIDVQNKKKIEDYQIEFMKKCKQVRERRLLFQQRIVNRDYVTILRNHEEDEGYLTRMIEQWADLKPPMLTDFTIEGLNQLQAVVKQKLEQVNIVQKELYQNDQLEQLILQQQSNSILNLNNQGLNDCDTIVIAQALRTNIKIHTLYLGNNQIKVTGAKRLADSLRYNKILTTLDLWSNQIGTTGAQHLADVLSINQTLIELGLNANNIDDKGAQYLADALRQNKTLCKLSLLTNPIGDEGAQNLLEALKINTTLKELHLLQNKDISTTARTRLQNEEPRFH